MAEATLKRLYYSLDQPSALSGVRRLYSAARRVHPRITIAAVQRWLERQDTYTLHRPANRKLKAEPRVFVKHIDDQWGIDLCDMNDIAEHNDGVRYILTYIDIFSKYAWALPVARKDGKSVSAAFRSILSKTMRRPKRIESDKGKEFYNHSFQRLMNGIGFEHFSTTSRHKCAVVERFNRSLKTLLYRSFDSRNSLRWLDVLDKVVAIYNKRKHRSIGIAPINVTRRNEQTIYKRLYDKVPKRGRQLLRGTLVRISKVKRTFEKGYLPNYTEEVFEIDRVYQRRPIQYELKDLLGDSLTGKFVAEELSPVFKDRDSIWKVEKVLKRDRRGRYFVKWYGFPEKFNSWVDEIQIQ
jgi:hypothetical protein